MCTDDLDREPEYGRVREIFVGFDDLDPTGAVHNARYALMLERASTEFWVEQGWNFDPCKSRIPDVMQVAREFKISYHAPIMGVGPVSLRFWVDHLGRTSYTYGFEFRSVDGATLHAAGHRVQVRLDPQTFSPIPISDTALVELSAIAKPAVVAGRSGGGTTGR